MPPEPIGQDILEGIVILTGYRAMYPCPRGHGLSGER